MSHILGQFLSSSGRYFDQLIESLEKATGNQARDAQLIGRVVTGANLKIRELGLTPGDTLPEEMYQALINKFINDSQVMHYQLLGDNVDFNFLNFQVAHQLNLIVNEPVFGLSDQAVIKALQAVPPKKLIKELNASSLEELLDKYYHVEILELAWALASKVWRTKIIAELQKLPNGGFELKELTYHQISRGLTGRYRELTGGQHFYHSSLTGSILYLNYSLSESRRQMALGTFIAGLIEARQLIDFSNQLQILAQTKYFLDNLENLFVYQNGKVWRLCDTPVPWRSIYRVLADSSTKLSQALKPELTGCQFGRLDLIEGLERCFDGLDYWRDAQALAFKSQLDIVSVNIADVAVNSHHSRRERLGQTNFFEDALWDELIRDYLEHDYLIRQVKLQLKSNPKEWN